MNVGDQLLMPLIPIEPVLRYMTQQATSNTLLRFMMRGKLLHSIEEQFLWRLQAYTPVRCLLVDALLGHAR